MCEGQERLLRGRGNSAKVAGKEPSKRRRPPKAGPPGETENPTTRLATCEPDFFAAPEGGVRPNPAQPAKRATSRLNFSGSSQNGECPLSSNTRSSLSGIRSSRCSPILVG